MNILSNHDLLENVQTNEKFDWKWLELILQKQLKTNATFGPRMQWNRIGQGKGYLSILLRIQFDWRSSDGALNLLPTSVVLKIPFMKLPLLSGKKAGNDSNSFQTALIMCHSCEVAFYELICNENIHLRVPRCFYAQKIDRKQWGILILEDLTESTFLKMPYESFTLYEIKQIVKELSKLHAFSLQNPLCLLNPDLQSSIYAINKSSVGMYEKLRRNMLVSLKNNFPQVFDPLINRFLDEFSLQSNYVNEMHLKLTLPAILNHGDCYMNNFLWRKSDHSDGDELAAMIDWQLVHPGSMGEDLVRLLCSSVNAQIRRNNLIEILNYYLQCLSKNLGYTAPFSLDQLHSAYYQLYPFGVAMILPGFCNFLNEVVDCKWKVKKLLNRAECLLLDLYD